jgi:hypothetical protein
VNNAQYFQNVIIDSINKKIRRPVNNPFSRIGKPTNATHLRLRQQQPRVENTLGYLMSGCRIVL